MSRYTFDHFTSDSHWFHRNIIRFCNRPYSDVDAMASGLVDAWNAVVAPGQTVLHVGDWTIGRLDDALSLMLNGNISLIPGNHDVCFSRDKNPARGRERFENAGITVLPEQIEISLTDSVTGVQVLFDASHFPFIGDSHGSDRYSDLRPIDRGRPLIHGHVHDEWHTRRAPIRPDGSPGSLMLNVGVDGLGRSLGYAPIRAQTVVDIALGRRPDLTD